jgi:hypothetical protein
MAKGLPSGEDPIFWEGSRVDGYVYGIPPVLPEAYLKIVALGSSGLKDVAEHHDSYLGRALHREHAR